MKKNKIILLLPVLFIGLNTNEIAAQTSTDFSKIPLTAYVPEQLNAISSSTKSILTDRLNQIAMQNGMGIGLANSRFIIAGNINILNKAVTPTAPAMILLDLEVTICIGDGLEGNKFASTTLSLNGIGTNETKAYIDAIKGIKPKDAALNSFIISAKKSIAEYYSSNCDLIITEAQTLASVNNNDAALAKLMQVPSTCKECYAKVLPLVTVVYKKQKERECKVQMNEAEAVWASKPNIEGAKEVANIITQIDPETECYKSAKSMIANINKTVVNKMNELDKREWDLKFMKEKSSIEVDKDRIKNARDIAIAFATNQPKTIYNTTGWW